jgi:hypothetical protein
MQVLTHRVQVLLVALAGVVVGIALSCLVLEMIGVHVFQPFMVDGLVMSHEPTLPSKIVLKGGGAQTDPSSTPEPQVTVSAPAHPR